MSLPDHVASYKNQKEKKDFLCGTDIRAQWAKPANFVIGSSVGITTRIPEEFLKKSAEPLTKLQLDKLKTRKI